MVSFRLDTKGLEEAIKQLKEATKGISDVDCTFEIFNEARATQDKDPENQIYYFDAVDRGRKAIVPVKSEKLHYRYIDADVLKRNENRKKQAHGKRWAVVDSVGPAPARHISQLAEERIRQGMAAVQKKLRESPLPSTARLFAARNIFEELIKTSWREATLERTEIHDVKKTLYDLKAGEGLADSFVLRRRGRK